MNIPFIGLNIIVPKEWIDVNGHMNATHYGLAVYDAHFNFTEAIGLGEAYVRSTNCGKAVLESHMIYEREVSEGDELEIKSWLLAVDKKRLHFFHEVYNITQGFRAAASEQVDIHIDLNARKSSELPAELYLQLQAIVSGYLKLPTPEGVGSNIKPPKNIWLTSR
ncbi:L-carnitine dehydrogenase [BD1-7 clade bacterium]|uniref:L-carnitine dehydrogenase n=1 Tax=BD1-7 clade bacterium TaxID=2029982 RepID=A0A5S9PKD8_9GAMM|nr:L-carnitine dehydrogenase [BD1-7 clade bacterium]CAA0104383.1 L-carnitine dehydrogenase [BD1-7 clade bacterium]